MDLMKKLSFQRIAGRFLAVCKRFPVVVLFIICTTATTFYYIADDGNVSEKIWFFCFYYFISGAILSLSLRLWSEEVRRWWVKIVVYIVVHLLWLGGAVYLSSLYPFDIIATTGAVAACTALGISVFLLPFFRDKNDMPSWNFAVRMVVAGSTAGLISVVVACGVNLLILSFDKLFGCAISDDAYTYVTCGCATLLAPMLFLLLVPDANRKHDYGADRLSRFMLGVIHYLYLPLLGAYLLTLYVYAARILITWQLPTGWVSSLVSPLMIGMVVVIGLLYPSRFVPGRRFDHFVMRWLPLMVLPLLALMSVAIGRRVGDYGFTVPRLYLLVFNVWCYGVCIVLAAIGSKRIGWVAATFAVVAAVVSVGPQSIANITYSTLSSEIKTSLSRAGVHSLPVHQQQWERWTQRTPRQEAVNITSKLVYIGSNYDHARLYTLVDSATYYSSSVLYRQQGNDIESYSDNGRLSVAAQMPKGYSRVAACSSKFTNITAAQIQSGVLSVPFTLNGDEENKEYTFFISINKLKAVEKQPAGRPLTFNNGQAMLYVTDFNLNIRQGKDDNDIQVNGLLFFK